MILKQEKHTMVLPQPEKQPKKKQQILAAFLFTLLPSLIYKSIYQSP